MLIEISNQLYENHNYCKFIRIPKYNLYESSRILNNTSHKILRNEIIDLSTGHFLFEDKEKIFFFNEKYYYMEGVHNNDINNIINKEQVGNRMKNFVEKCYSNLNFISIIFKVNNEIKEINGNSTNNKEFFE